jgi:hypothetical protein
MCSSGGGCEGYFLAGVTSFRYDICRIFSTTTAMFYFTIIGFAAVGQYLCLGIGFERPALKLKPFRRGDIGTS